MTIKPHVGTSLESLVLWNTSHITSAFNQTSTAACKRRSTVKLQVARGRDVVASASCQARTLHVYLTNHTCTLCFTGLDHFLVNSRSCSQSTPHSARQRTSRILPRRISLTGLHALLRNFHAYSSSPWYVSTAFLLCLEDRTRLDPGFR